MLLAPLMSAMTLLAMQPGQPKPATHLQHVLVEHAAGATQCKGQGQVAAAGGIRQRRPQPHQHLQGAGRTRRQEGQHLFTTAVLVHIRLHPPLRGPCLTHTPTRVSYLQPSQLTAVAASSWPLSEEYCSMFMRYSAAACSCTMQGASQGPG